MASIIIRRLEQTTKEQLRVRASRHGRSMEEEARAILKVALTAKGAPERSLADSIRRRFDPLGGVKLPARARDSMREPPKLDR
jgi:plasmid stability protein